MSAEPRKMTERQTRCAMKACRRYERALIHGDSARRIDGDLRSQFDGFRRATERDVVTMGMVRTVLCSCGVLPDRFVPYYNFARHLRKLLRLDMRGTLLDETRLAVCHWAGKGYDPAVLKKICRDVFNIEIGPLTVDAGKGPGV